VISITSESGDVNIEVVKSKTSGVSFFYEAIFRGSLIDNAYSVLFSNEMEDGVNFVPVRASVTKVSNISNTSASFSVICETRKTASVYKDVDVEIPKFIRAINLETRSISETGDWSFQIAYRREDVSTHKQVIHAI